MNFTINSAAAVLKFSCVSQILCEKCGNYGNTFLSWKNFRENNVFTAPLMNLLNSRFDEISIHKYFVKSTLSFREHSNMEIAAI